MQGLDDNVGSKVFEKKADCSSMEGSHGKIIQGIENPDRMKQVRHTDREYHI
jgi:hypothetical protein